MVQTSRFRSHPASLLHGPESLVTTRRRQYDRPCAAFTDQS
jgi:hypothetical protein